MFDLKQRVSEWRSRLKSSSGLNREVLDELEAHLIESYHRLKAKHEEVKAFELAVAQLGQPKAIGNEFSKLKYLQPRDRWVLLGNSWVLGAFALLWVIGAGVLIFNGRVTDPMLAIHVATISFGYLLPLFLIFIGGYSVWKYSRGKSSDPAYRDRLVKQVQIILLVSLVLCLVGVVTGQIWGYRVHLDSEILWGPKVILGIGVVVSLSVGLGVVFRASLTEAQVGILCLVFSFLIWNVWFFPDLLALDSRWPILTAVFVQLVLFIWANLASMSDGKLNAA